MEAPGMLGSDQSRGYCLEMIGADFLAGANLENGNPDVLLMSLASALRLPISVTAAAILARHQTIGMSGDFRKRRRLRLDSETYRELKLKILERDGSKCQRCGGAIVGRS